MAEPEEQQRVSFTVKELLGQINTKLDVMALAIAAKAEAAVVERLATRVDALEREATVIKALRVNRRWLIGTAIAAVAAFAALLAVLLRVHISLAP
jgi:hypothetical protein